VRGTDAGKNACPRRCAQGIENKGVAEAQALRDPAIHVGHLGGEAGMVSLLVLHNGHIYRTHSAIENVRIGKISHDKPSIHSVYRCCGYRIDL
jgi:hypothetical protein